MNKQLLLLVPLALAAGCATPPHYEDSTEAHTYSRNFTAYDFQTSAQEMVDQMLASPILAANLAAFQGGRAMIQIYPIQNQTYQMDLNLDTLNNMIRMRVLNSGKFRFAANAGTMQHAVGSDLSNPLANPGQITAPGSHNVADYVLSGSLAEMRDAGGRTRESYYVLSMTLENKHTGEVDWAGEKTIRKESKRAGIGW